MLLLLMLTCFGGVDVDVFVVDVVFAVAVDVVFCCFVVGVAVFCCFVGGVAVFCRC